MKTKELTLYALLISAAMILSYMESLLPVFAAVPGVKVGFANIAIIFALYKMGNKAAISISLLRIFLSSLLFANMFAMLYSIAGALLSLTTMILLKKTNKLSIITVSIVGAVMHNLGQIIVAVFVLQTKELMYYMAPLTLSGVCAGAVIGVAAGLVTERIKINI